MKTCTKCEHPLDEINFRKNSKCKDKLNYWCKTCESLVKNAWKNANRERELANLKYANNKRRKGIDKRPIHSTYKESNILSNSPDYMKLYMRNRLSGDLDFKIACALRSRLHSAIKNCQKTGSAVNDLGCSVEELKTYLECKFQPGMSWNNWSKNGWHIDHIQPLTSFDLTDREQLLKACNYTNLQPLWAKDNLQKGFKIPKL